MILFKQKSTQDYRIKSARNRISIEGNHDKKWNQKEGTYKQKKTEQPQEAGALDQITIETNTTRRSRSSRGVDLVITTNTISSTMKVQPALERVEPPRHDLRLFSVQQVQCFSPRAARSDGQQTGPNAAPLGLFFNRVGGGREREERE